MARIRSVKPELFSDEKLAGVSIQARYLYVGLFTESDDEGRMHASAKRLAGALFPHDEKVSPAIVKRWLSELENIGRVIRYDVQGYEYLFLPNFRKHQKISHPTPSKLPAPPESLRNPSGTAPEKFVPEQGTGSKEQGAGSIVAATPQQSMFGAVVAVMGYDLPLATADEREIGGVAKALLDKGMSPEELPTYVEWITASPDSPLVSGRRLTLHSLPKWVKDYRAKPRIVATHDPPKLKAANALALADQLEAQGR